MQIGKQIAKRVLLIFAEFLAAEEEGDAKVIRTTGRWVFFSTNCSDLGLEINIKMERN